MSSEGVQIGGGRSGFLGFVPSMVIKNILDDRQIQVQSDPSKMTMSTSVGGTVINKVSNTLPIKQELRSVVMFADISGFTNLTEKYSQIGPEGNEIIAFAINRYMELMVQEIGKSGGDIFKFAGDAMIVVWPPAPDDEKDKEQFLLNSCHLAVQSAVNIQKKLKETKIVDSIMLSVKIGFGIGDFSIIYVGGVLNRAEYLPAGPPLIQAFESESHAEKGGVVIISEEVQICLKDKNYFEMIEVTKKDDKMKFFQVTHARQKVRNVSQSLQIKEQLSAAQIEIIRPDVEKYIPKALRQYVNLGVERWSSELRWISVLFMNIGIDLNLATTTQGLNRIQKVIECIQKCIYFQEGSLNKFLMDDKGSTMIIAFGLPPTSHEDDAARACLCARQIQKNLSKHSKHLEKIDTGCSIGISTGLVFAGVVGTSGNRREYSVIGDSVNLSARIMSCACKEKQKSILVDETTAKHAMGTIDFEFWDWKKFKGKSMYLPIYEPLFHSDRPNRMTESQSASGVLPMNAFPAIRTHRFSFPNWNPKYQNKPSDEPEEQKAVVPQIPISAANVFLKVHKQHGFLDQNITPPERKDPKQCEELNRQLRLFKTIILSEDKYEKAYGIFKQFMKGLQNQQLKGKIMRCKGFAIIRGPAGVGKTLFLRKLLSNIQEDILKRSSITFKYDESMQIIVSSINSKTAKYKCNGMRKVIKTMFRLLLKRKGISSKCNNPDQPDQQTIDLRIKCLYQVMPSLAEASGAMQTTILQLFGLKKFNLLSCFDPPPTQAATKNQHPPPPPPQDADEVMKIEYLEIASLVREFFSAYLEQQENYNQPEISQSQNIRHSFNPKLFVAPLIICLEDIHKFDLYSFKLIRTLLKYFDNIQFFATARTNFFERPVALDPKAKIVLQEDTYSDAISTIEELLLDFSVDLFQVVDLHDFSQKDTPKVKELVRQVFNIEHLDYQSTTSKPVKTEDDREELEDHTNQQWLLFNQLKEKLQTNPKHFFFSFIQFKTNGNPLAVIDLVESFIQSKMLLISPVNVTVAELQAMKYLTPHNYRRTAFITQELRSLMLSEEFLTINAPMTKRKLYGPILDQLKTEELLIMKIASVIGQVFDLKMLSSVHPFKELLQQEQVKKILSDLESRKFIEILEHTSDNVYFRCTNSFIREVTYQRMDFSQRRQLHLNVADRVASSTSLGITEIQEMRRLIYHQKLGESNRHKDTQEDQQFELKAKRAIIVKRVTKILQQNSSDRMCMLHSGIISKQSDRGVTWADRYVILTVYDLRYYHDKTEFDNNPSECLASVMLKDIIHFERVSETSSRCQFTLHAQRWYKKDQLKSNQRIFNFASSSGMFDEWLIYIEYAKTFQQYNNFVQNFGKIDLQFDQTNTLLKNSRVLEWQTSDRSIQSHGAHQKRDSSVSSRLQRPMMLGNSFSQSNSSSPSKQKKMSVILKKAIKEEEESNSISDAEANQQNKLRIKTFIQKGLMLFMSHIAEMSILANDRYKTIGQSTLFVNKNPHFFKIDPTINQMSPKQRKSNPDEFSQLDDTTQQKKQAQRLSKETLSEIIEEEEDLSQKRQLKQANNLKMYQDSVLSEESDGLQGSPLLPRNSLTKAKRPFLTHRNSNAKTTDGELSDESPTISEVRIPAPHFKRDTLNLTTTQSIEVNNPLISSIYNNRISLQETTSHELTSASFPHIQEYKQPVQQQDSSYGNSPQRETQFLGDESDSQLPNSFLELNPPIMDIFDIRNGQTMQPQQFANKAVNHGINLTKDSSAVSMEKYQTRQSYVNPKPNNANQSSSLLQENEYLKQQNEILIQKLLAVQNSQEKADNSVLLNQMAINPGNGFIHFDDRLKLPEMKSRNQSNQDSVNQSQQSAQSVAQEESPQRFNYTTLTNQYYNTQSSNSSFNQSKITNKGVQSSQKQEAPFQILDIDLDIQDKSGTTNQRLFAEKKSSFHGQMTSDTMLSDQQKNFQVQNYFPVKLASSSESCGNNQMNLSNSISYVQQNNVQDTSVPRINGHTNVVNNYSGTQSNYLRKSNWNVASQHNLRGQNNSADKRPRQSIFRDHTHSSSRDIFTQTTYQNTDAQSSFTPQIRSHSVATMTTIQIEPKTLKAQKENDTKSIQQPTSPPSLNKTFLTRNKSLSPKRSQSKKKAPFK